MLHEEYVYYYGRKLHQGCASAEALERRGAGDDPVEAARGILEAGQRVVLTRAQLRALVALAVGRGLEPVRKPDSGRMQWYGKMAGWSAARVKAGLAASEVAGMWLDFMDAGRMPPLRTVDLSVIMDVVDRDEKTTAEEAQDFYEEDEDPAKVFAAFDSAPKSIVTSPLPSSEALP